MATLTSTQKLLNLIQRKPATCAQIVKQCGFASKQSVTSVIASLRTRGYRIDSTTTDREGFVRYSM